MNLTSLVVAESAVAVINGGQTGRFMIGKKETEGSFARAIAFASKDQRAAMGQALYVKWLASGTYRPLVTDILNCGLIPKAAIPVVQEMAGLRDAGGVSKETLIRLCRAIQRSVENSVLDGKKAPAGQKGYVYGVVNAIANAAPSEGEAIDVKSHFIKDEA